MHATDSVWFFDALLDARRDAAQDAYLDWCDARGFDYDDPDALDHYARS